MQKFTRGQKSFQQGVMSGGRCRLRGPHEEVRGRPFRGHIAVLVHGGTGVGLTKCQSRFWAASGSEKLRLSSALASLKLRSAGGGKTGEKWAFEGSWAKVRRCDTDKMAE